MDQVLEFSHVSKLFERKGQSDLLAVDDASFTLAAGECLGLVGGSGCGKSTIAQMATGLLEQTSGQIRFGSLEVGPKLRGKARRELAQRVQMVFQNPVSSFNPRRTLGDGIAEGLVNFGMASSEAAARARELLERCGLPADYAGRYPREVSGGQAQRAAIARALALGPALVILDEATSALDVTVQAQIVELLRDIRDDSGMAYLFICHDLALVQGFCDRVLVMQQGRIVEEGPATSLISNPHHPYTQQLIDSVLEV